MDDVRVRQVIDQLRSGATLSRQLGTPAADAQLLDDLALQLAQAIEPKTPGTPFAKDLESLLNMHCQENLSHTPDFILAQFLVTVLAAWNVAVTQRETWYGRDMGTPASLFPKNPDARRI